MKLIHNIPTWYCSPLSPRAINLIFNCHFTGVEVVLWWSSPGQVCLSLEGGFAAHSDKARLGMRFGFRCLFFRWISLVRFAESRDFFCPSGRWFVPDLYKLW